MGDDELEEIDDKMSGENILGLGGDISGNSVYGDDVFESPKQGRDSVRRFRELLFIGQIFVVTRNSKATVKRIAILLLRVPG